MGWSGCVQVSIQDDVEGQEKGEVGRQEGLELLVHEMREQGLP